MGRVVAIGLDATDEADLFARIDAGTMPNLAALRARGTWCPLEIDELCRSEHPWPTFVTGQEPAHLGRWTGVGFDAATYQYTTKGAPAVPPFWGLADGVGTVIFDVPTSTLSPDSSGPQIIDWAAHDPAFPRCSKPTELMAEIDTLVGPNPATPLEYAGVWHNTRWLKAYGPALVESVAMRTDVIDHLLASTSDWDLAVVVFAEAHQLAHHSWHGVSQGSALAGTPSATLGRAASAMVHTALDEAVGHLTERLEPDDVVVVFAPKGLETVCDLPSNVLAPELAYRLAFGQPLLRQPRPGRRAGRIRSPITLPRRADYVTAMDNLRHGRRPYGFREAVHQAAVAVAEAVAPSLVERRRLRAAEGQQPWTAPDPDTLAPTDGERYPWLVSTWHQDRWTEMPWFVLPSFSDLHVRINLAGREQDGMTPADGYVQACDEVERTLRACTNPRTGNPMVGAVSRPRGDDPFHDPGVAADLVVTWAEDTDVLEHPEVGVVGPYPAWRVSGHSTRGYALFAGGDIGPGTLAGVRIVDLTATLLDLAGGQVPAAMDGTPVALHQRSAAEV